MNIQELRRKLREVPLPSLETMEVGFRETVHAIVTGDENPRDLQAELYLVLQYGRGRVTLGEFIAVLRSEYVDPVYQDLVLALETFAQSPNLKHVALKKLPQGRVEMRHLMMALADKDVLQWCQENLTDEEKGSLAAEAKRRDFNSADEYVKACIKVWIRRK
jgi:hypothetical protein